jgi:hypothetical protein
MVILSIQKTSLSRVEYLIYGLVLTNNFHSPHPRVCTDNLNKIRSVFTHRTLYFLTLFLETLHVSAIIRRKQSKAKTQI